jgi:hypothetical protein
MGYLIIVKGFIEKAGFLAPLSMSIIRKWVGNGVDALS